MPLIIGTSGDDTGVTILTGSSGSDTILGLAGNDVLFGVEGADYMIGGAGNDKFAYSFAAGGEVGDGLGQFDYLEGGAGFDSIQALASVNLSGAFLGSIEGIEFSNNFQISDRQVQVKASQFKADGTGLSTDLVLNGDVQSDNLLVFLDGQSLFDMSGFQFADWFSGTVATFYANDRVTVIGGADAEKIIGTSRNDDVIGYGGADRIYGGGGVDILNGEQGNDVLYGGVGGDVITTGSGQDIIVFDSTPNSATNVDLMYDFVVADDTIWMKKAIFTGLGALGTLTADQFKTIGIAGASVDATDRVIYDRSTGFLYYDVNGSAAGGAAKIAAMASGLQMTHLDFHVFA
jgi:serralysin